MKVPLLLPSFRILLAVLVASPLWGFSIRKEESDRYAVKWYQDEVEVRIGLSQSLDLSSGKSMAGAFAEVVNTWQGHIGVLTLKPVFDAGAPDAGYNETNTVTLRHHVMGDAFGPRTLAVTLTWRSTIDVTGDSDIIFNQNRTWDDYQGPLRDGVIDMRRVALHEFGHLLGLLHPDDAGQTVDAVMNSVVSDTDRLTEDDIAGGQHLYGVPGQVPTNNGFTEAAEIPASFVASWSATGSTVGADREGGEPSHADVSEGHSIWWKWTPVENHHVTISTYGSDFDTILSVYRGNTLSNLELLVENDDEELPEHNSGIDRKRTSLVELNVTAGQNYYLAVDGWGDVANSFPGLTGAVALSLTPSPSWATPEIVSQPSATAVKAQSFARFQVRHAGYPEPSYQWQRQSGGSGNWENLSDSGSQVVGSQSPVLELEAFAHFSGDRFRCVLNNSSGQTVSAPATLTLAADAPPVIFEQPVDQRFISPAPAVLWIAASNTTSLAWYKDGQLIPGATGRSLTLDSSSYADEGTYHVVASNGGVQVSSDPFTVTMNLGARMRLKNLSVRNKAARGDQTLMMGFAVGGAGPLPLLIRGVGPGLANFGVPSVASDPSITIYDAGQSVLDANDNWVTSTETTATFSRLGAFALTEGSGDAVVIREFIPGANSTHVTPGNGSEGTVVIEAYDAVVTEGAAQLSNLSARTEVGTGNEVLIAGFVLSGDGEKRLLIRGVGPTLANYGLPVASLLGNPQLEIHQGTNLVAANNDWGGTADLRTAFQTVGAFDLPTDTSQDAALVVSLPAGVYTATVSGADGGTGVALVEIYELP